MYSTSRDILDEFKLWADVPLNLSCNWIWPRVFKTNFRDILFGLKEKMWKERKLQKSMDELRLTLVQIHPSLSVIFFLPLYFHKTKHT
jgi:hypothetical protein